MDANLEYQRKLYQPDSMQEKLLTLLHDHQNLILAMSVAMPPGLISVVASAIKKNQLNDINLYYMHGTQALQETLLTPELVNKFNPRAIFMSSHDRAAIKSNQPNHWLEFVPATFHQVGRLLTEHVEPHCFMATVSPMDKHGYFSLGTNADYGASVIRKAKGVVLEVNRHMPRTFGECSIHISEVDAIIENHQPLMELAFAPPCNTDLIIAKQIAEQINNGDTLQMGVGGVPSAVLGLLNQHQNLGLHSELFSPGMVDLIQSGVINGKFKSWMQHKHVFTLAIGDRKLYEFMDDNPSIVGYPASWVNNPDVIQKNNNMVSVNAAIEVDLSGQINAEQLNGLPFSGTGGQLDFVRGAYASKNGRSFIALHSTAKQGSISRIVPKLTGGTVTDTRMDTQFVVTEFGCVNLKGLSLPQRSKALIQLAHPDFRETLEMNAKAQGLG